jgi:hypothetical protein
MNADRRRLSIEPKPPIGVNRRVSAAGQKPGSGVKRGCRLLILLVVSAWLTAGVCEKVPDRQWDRENYQPLPGNTKGFAPPAGLEIVTLVGALDITPQSDLPLDMTVRNGKTARLSVTFPAGLVFLPVDATYQYMILLQDYKFSVPVGADTVISLPTYCCNDMLDTPDETAAYTLGPREYEKEMNELLDIVAAKHLSGDTAVTLAQDALFEITDGTGLTDSMKTLLRALP